MPARRLALIVPTAALAIGIPTVAIAMIPSLASQPATVTAVAPGAPLRLVVGKQAVTDAAGATWYPDASLGVEGNLSHTTDAIAGTADSALFQTTRWGTFSYHVAVTQPGIYHVQLNESENYWHGPRQRVFSVTAEGSPVLTAVDINQTVGFEHATSLGFDVPVNDGTLDLGFSASIDNAKVDSLLVSAVTEQAPSTPDTAAPSSSTSPGTEPPTTAPSTTEPPSSTSLGTEPPNSTSPDTTSPGTEPPSTEPPTTEPPSTSPPSSAPPSTAPPAATPTDAAAPTSPAAPTGPAAPDGNIVTPLAYGATGDGVTDDTASLQRTFDAATPGRPIVLPAGRIFAHSGVLHLRVAGTHLTGPGTLLATNEATSSVWVEADNVTIDGGLVLRTASTTQRWSTWEQMGLRLVGHSGAMLRDITVEGSAAAGIYIGGADHFTLMRVTVANTRADGIHMTGGANNGVITNPTTIATGDDGIAVVSYGSDAQPCHDITVTGAHVMTTTGGRGMSVVGGTAITYTAFDIERSAAAGLYIAAEGAPWNSYAPIDVTASGGQITGANTDPTIDHGAIVVLSGETRAVPSGVTVSNVGISDTRSTASRDVGVITYGTPPNGVTLDNVTITGGPTSAYSGNTPASSYLIHGWTVNGQAYNNG